MLLRQVRPALACLGLFTIITGVLYPLLVTLIAQAVFPEKANGSFIQHNGKLLGSELIGQPFSDPKYFWSRPSIAPVFPYNAAASSGSNYGPLSSMLLDGVNKRVNELKNADPQNANSIPADLATASASGLDPHISIAAALYQVPRIARIRSMNDEQVRALVNTYTQ